MNIPSDFYTVPYNFRVNPDNPPLDYLDLSSGSNCLIFAYAILKCNHLFLPILWSRELWEDQLFTQKVQDFQELDLLFFGNNRDDAYWWHVGVSLGGDKLIHLSKEV